MLAVLTMSISFEELTIPAIPHIYKPSLVIIKIL